MGLPAAGGFGLLLATGLIVVITAPLQATGHHGWTAVTAVTATMTVLIFLTALLPWRHLPALAHLTFPAAAVLAVAALSVYGNGLGAAYVGVYVLAFVYVGLFTPPRTCWWLLPLAVVLYGPTAGGWSRGIAVRLVVVALVWVLVAEVLAALTARQRSALGAMNAAARTDVLTGLDNRRALHDHLISLTPGAVVVVCDLDHFKVVNDTRGHLYGDQVLTDFAAVLHEALRHDDHAARYGGEEFVLLLRADHGAVPAVLARLHQRWALAYPAITFSTGWAVHTGSRPAHTTVGAADQALYEAKASGRNRDVRESDTAHLSHPPQPAAHQSAPPLGPLPPSSADQTAPPATTTSRTATPAAGDPTAAGQHRPAPVLEDISS